MPNWCMNQLTVKGTKSKLAAFRKKAKTAESDFSFEPFLPMPKELGNSVANFKENPEMVIKYGFSSWYQRNCNVLGTKWDVKGELDCIDSTQLGYTFDSAWSPPIAGVIRLSEKFLDLEFTLTFDEPGMDFAGEVVIKGGEIVSETTTKSPSNAEMHED